MPSASANAPSHNGMRQRSTHRSWALVGNAINGYPFVIRFARRRTPVKVAPRLLPPPRPLAQPPNPFRNDVIGPLHGPRATPPV